MNWNGEDRRKNGQKDHDMLTRIDVNLETFIKQFENHVKQDEASFTEIRSNIDVLRKYVYVGIGAMLALEFILKALGEYTHH